MRETSLVNVFIQNAVPVWIDLKAPGIVCAIEAIRAALRFELPSARPMAGQSDRKPPSFAYRARSTAPACPRSLPQCSRGVVCRKRNNSVACGRAKPRADEIDRNGL